MCSHLLLRGLGELEVRQAEIIGTQKPSGGGSPGEGGSVPRLNILVAVSVPPELIDALPDE